MFFLSWNIFLTDFFMYLLDLKANEAGKPDLGFLRKYNSYWKRKPSSLGVNLSQVVHTIKSLPAQMRGRIRGKTMKSIMQPDLFIPNSGISSLSQCQRLSKELSTGTGRESKGDSGRILFSVTPNCSYTVGCRLVTLT